MVGVDKMVSKLSFKKMVSNHLKFAYNVHSKLHHGCAHNVFFNFKGAILIGPSISVFGTLVMPLIEAPLCTF